MGEPQPNYRKLAAFYFFGAALFACYADHIWGNLEAVFCAVLAAGLAILALVLIFRRQWWERLNRVTIFQAKIITLVFTAIFVFNGLAGRGPAVGGREWWMGVGGAVGMLIRCWWIAIHQDRADKAGLPAENPSKSPAQ